MDDLKIIAIQNKKIPACLSVLMKACTEYGAKTGNSRVFERFKRNLVAAMSGTATYKAGVVDSDDADTRILKLSQHADSLDIDTVRTHLIFFHYMVTTADLVKLQAAHMVTIAFEWDEFEGWEFWSDLVKHILKDEDLVSKT